MTSLFENVRGTAMPVDLMMRELRGVSLLEFSPLFAAIEQEQVREAEVTPTPAVDDRALQVAAMIDAARAEAGSAVRRECEEEFAARLEVERARVGLLCSTLAQDRAHYFAEVEAEVVKLALAVATRVLMREAEVDGMYLSAIVRAALGRVRDGSTSVLRVHPGEALDWLELGLARVEVVGDELITAGECVLETSVGRVELGVRPQMEEVSLTFADLSDRREA